MSQNYEILAPRLSESIESDGFDQVVVRVKNNDIGVNLLFFGAVVPLNQAATDLVQLAREGNTPFWSGPVPAAPVPDTIPAANNKTAVVHAFEGDDDDDADEQTVNFKASHGLPTGSGSRIAVLTAQYKARLSRPGQLVPVSVTLKLNSKVTKGTGARCADLNQPTVLLHTENAKWLSRPIAFCGKSEPEGFWVLHKSSQTAWTLVLQQGEKVVVTFKAKTKPKDCTFPIKLKRKGSGSKVCKEWPKSVTVFPTP